MSEREGSEPKPASDPTEVAAIGDRRRAAAAETDATREAEQRRALAEEMMRELSAIERRLDERAATPRLAIGQINLRRKPRFVVEASVLLDHEGHLATMPLLNVSLTGALVAMTHVSFGPPRPGTLLFVTLFATKDATWQVDVNARVMRCDDRGLALDWSEDHATSHAVAVFLDRLSS